MAASPPPDPSSYPSLGARFAVEREVTTGGMGRILRARDRHRGDAPVAIKLANVHDDVNLARFERECDALARVTHPNVVRHVAHGRTRDGEPWLAMEWLEGIDLGYRLDQLHSGPTQPNRTRMAPLAEPALEHVDGPPTRPDSPNANANEHARANPSEPPVPLSALMLSVQDALLVGRGMAAGLAAIHGAGVVHRDVKPSNVFLVGGSVSRVKLIALGIAQVGSTSPGARAVTETGALIGTPFYMAPEQARADRTLGPAVDVFALGCVLYECLAGVSPFHAELLASALAKILFLEPTPIASLRPDVPDTLAAAIGAMLHKSPSMRPSDGAAALALLETVPLDQVPDTVDVERITRESVPNVLTSDRVSELTHAERRALCLLFVRDPAHDSAVDPGGVLARMLPPEPRLLAQATPLLEHTGTRSAPLLDGSVVIAADGQVAPTDAATRLARAGLRLLRANPSLALVLSAERTELRTHETTLLSAAGSRSRGASMQQQRARAGEVLVDESTAALLEARFELAPERGAFRVVRERPVESVRTLLGRPTQTVGRKRDLALLETTWDECEGERLARAVLVTAGPGVGKTRLVHEFLRTLRAKGTPFELLQGYGDAVSAGAPFMMLGSAVRRAAGLADGGGGVLSGERERAALDELVSRAITDTAERAKHLPLLGVLAGVHFDDASSEILRAARTDPVLLADAVRTAFCAWLAAVTREKPLVLVLEDLHWGDLPSVRLLDAALGSLADRPLFVFALARPEVKNRFPDPFPGKPLTEHRLEPLPARAAGELVRQCLPDASDAVVEALVRRSAGHAFYLEELIRCVAEGGVNAAQEALPESVLAMVQARLDAVGLEGRRVLRAASVFGEAFWGAGLERLLEGPSPRDGTSRWLAELASREMISPASETRIPGQREYRFRHALVRDGAYASLTEADRARAHRRAGAWLEEVGAHDAVSLAMHFREGGEPEKAVRWLVRAAEQALDGNDLEAACRHATDAEQAGAEGQALGTALALRAIAEYWRSGYEQSAADGERSLGLLPEGSSHWYTAAASALVSCARRGEFERFDRVFARVRSVERAEEGAESERLVCLCRGAFQLVFNGRFDAADAVLRELPATETLDEDARLDARTKAQVHHVRGVRAAMVGDVGAFFTHLARAVAHFERAGDMRNVLLERTTLGWCHAEVGEAAEGVRLIRENLARCVEQKAPQAVTYAKVNLGYALSLLPDAASQSEARAVLEESVDECAAVSNARLEGWARAHLADVEYRAGNVERSEEHARVAETKLAAAPVLHAWALASHARALLAIESAPRVSEVIMAPDENERTALPPPAFIGDALSRARRAMEALERAGGLLQGESLPPLVLVACLRAHGLREESDRVAREAVERLERRAARLPRPEWREGFLALPTSVETRALVEAMRER